MRIIDKRYRTALYLATLFVLSLASTAAWAQAQPFSHIVVVVQENRTPDNLFGSSISGSPGCNGQDDFEPGVDIVNGGKNKTVNGGFLCLSAHPLGPDPVNPDHTHVGFKTMYDNGNLDNCTPKSGLLRLRQPLRRAAVLRHRHQLRLRELHVSNQ
jgi:hypothetical protein